MSYEIGVVNLTRTSADALTVSLTYLYSGPGDTGRSYPEMRFTLDILADGTCVPRSGECDCVPPGLALPDSHAMCAHAREHNPRVDLARGALVYADASFFLDGWTVDQANANCAALGCARLSMTDCVRAVNIAQHGLAIALAATVE